MRTSNISDEHFSTIRGHVSSDNEAGFVRHRYQEVTDDFLANLAEKRVSTANSRLPDMTLVASIPAVFVVKWMDEGFNVYRESLDAIIRKIKENDLDGFLATNRRMT